MRYFLMGYMGSGKSAIGKALARRLALPFLDLDELIEKQEGLTISEYFARHGEPAFRKVEHEALKAALIQEDFVMALGGGTPCQPDNLTLIRANGTSIYLKVPVDMLYGRLKQIRAHRPLLAHLSDGELRPFIERQLEEREAFYLKADLVADEKDLNAKKIEDLIRSNPIS